MGWRGDIDTIWSDGRWGCIERAYETLRCDLMRSRRWSGYWSGIGLELAGMLVGNAYLEMAYGT
jgi:hypothetical protein